MATREQTRHSQLGAQARGDWARELAILLEYAITEGFDELKAGDQNGYVTEIVAQARLARSFRKAREGK